MVNTKVNETTPRNLLILILNAWVQVQVSFFPLSYFHKKSTRTMARENVTSMHFIGTRGFDSS
jgi:hypothetical protein